MVNKFTRSGMFKDSLWVGLAQVFSIFSVILLNSVLTRSLSKSDFGNYQLYLSYASILALFSFSSFNAAISKACAKKYDIFFRTAFKISLSGSSIAMLISLFIAGFFYLNGDITLAVVSLIIGTFTFSNSFNLYDSALNGKQLFKVSRILTISINAFKFVAIGFVAFYTKSVLYTFACTVLVHLMGSFTGLQIVKRYMDNTSAKDEETELDLKQLGWKLFSLQIFAVLASRIEKIILGSIDPVMLGIYHIGSIIPRNIKDNGKAFISVPIMHWATRSGESNKRVILKYWWIFIGAGLIGFLGVYFFSGIFVKFFFTEAYTESIQISILLSISLIFLFLQNVMHSYMIYQGHESTYRLLSIAGSSIKIVGFIFLIPLQGIYGIIYTIILTELFLFLITIFLFLTSKNQNGV